MNEEPMNLTLEEVDDLNNFAIAVMAGLCARTDLGAMIPDTVARWTFAYACAAVAQQRQVLAKHAAPAVDICTNNCIQGYIQDTGFTECPTCNAAPALPADVPPPPEGFVYAKFGKLDSTANSDETLDVAGHVKSVGWIIGYYGAQDNYHYAVRIGSDVAARNGLEGGAR